MSALADTPLIEVRESVTLLRMTTVTRSVDLYLEDFEARCSPNSIRNYTDVLSRFSDRFPQDWQVTKVTVEDCRRALAVYKGKSLNYRYSVDAILRSFFNWLVRNDYAPRNPLDKLDRPRRLSSEDMDVLTVTTADVRRMLDAAHGWSEELCLHVLAYCGPRRNAAAQLRLRDYDRDSGRLRFHEKGGKVIWKPIPQPLRDKLDAAIAAGVIVEPEDYLIPPRGPLTRRGDRNNRVVYDIVKAVAARVGVEAHVHAFRAAFAVYCDETLPDLNPVTLKDLMGHASLDTTMGYLRRRDKQRAMERVRELSWADNTNRPGLPQNAGEGFEESGLVGAGGFEPPFGEPRFAAPSHSLEPASDLSGALLDEAKGASNVVLGHRLYALREPT